MLMEYIVPEALAVMPARAFFKQHINISSRLWKKIKHSGHFTLNGIPVNPALTMVVSGDIITYDIEEPANTILPMELPLDIRYEDDYMLIVNKPAGQLVHPSVKENTYTLANAVLGYYQKKAYRHAFHPVHRLDRLTSGLVLIAKLPQIQYQLSKYQAFQRAYLALIPGRLSPAEGRIEAPIARKEGSIIERCVSSDGKCAATCYRTLKCSEACSLVELHLETGRTHQIRVHLAHIKHPLLGDDLYGGDQSLIQRQALHAYHIKFQHPVTGKMITLFSPLPEDMSSIVTSFL
jgi:23S rRNA pseudouridine1911/1915/1917 synthase